MYSHEFIPKELTDYLLLTAFAGFLLHVIFLSFLTLKRFWKADCTWICWRMSSRQGSVGKCECECVYVSMCVEKGKHLKLFSTGMYIIS